MRRKGPIVVVLGTRPEAIKLAPLVLEGRRQGLDVLLCNTGQHREMSAKVLELFGLVPEIDLEIMQPGQTLTDVTVRVLKRLQDELIKLQPSWVVVQGDTTTAFAAALAAFYQKIPVAHVEAGLRTGDIYAPWPEEMNRLLVGSLATLHFPPTPLAAKNLKSEGVPSDSLLITGNTGIDALKIVVYRLEADQDLRDVADRALLDAGLPQRGKRPYVLVTCHRRESFGAGLAAICTALSRLAERFPDYDFIYPVHPNPQVRSAVEAYLGDGRLANIYLIAPLEYLPFVALMSEAFLIMTDSGGVQEEAPSLGKRVVVLRDETERSEGLATGLIRMAGTNTELIISEAVAAITGQWSERLDGIDVYGDGHASGRIIGRILETGTATV